MSLPFARPSSSAGAATLGIAARFRPTLLAAASLLLPGASSAEPRAVELPLVVPYAFLQRLLVEQVFTGPEATARIGAADDACNEVVLSEPRLAHREGRLAVVAHGSAEAGFSWLGDCFRPFHWEGEIDAEEAVRVAPDAPVVLFSVVDSRLRGSGGWGAVPALWEWIKPVVHPRLEAFRVDLSPLVDELRATLPLFADRRWEAGAPRFVQAVELTGASLEERGLLLHLRLEVETAPVQEAAPAPPLTPEELAAVDQALREWDAFVTFVVKVAGRDALVPARRAELLAVLIDARHELVAALEEPGGEGDDRVRELFLSAWTRLAPSFAELSGGADGFRYLAFVAAADALAALDAAGPAFGLEISSDGLRRLARTLAPASPEDPLRWSEDVDVGLRETFGFELPLPALPPPEPEAPAPALPPPGGEPEAAPGPGAASSWLGWLASRVAAVLVAPARAAPAAPPPAPTTSALDLVAPGPAELDAYLPKVAELLRDAASRAFAHGGLEPERLEPFRHLVLAAAWQESCWRQYVERSGRLEPLRSSVGALGLMQVHPRVWRGFYAVDGLAWSISYNARAGSEILLHYLRDYAIARGEELQGGPDALARASYAAYHGGPSHLRRYREPRRWSGKLVAIDRAFQAKYRAVAEGGELGVRECFPG